MVKFWKEQGPDFWAWFESDDFGEDGVKARVCLCTACWDLLYL